MIELLGIIGTLCIVYAFTQNGEIRIRIFDTIGAIFFIVYGIFIQSLSTIVLNIVLVSVQVLKLIQYYKHKEK